MSKIEITCLECGKKYIGSPNSRYCPECVKRRQRAGGKAGAEIRRRKREEQK